MQMLTAEQVAELLANAAGNVSYVSDTNFFGTKTTALVSDHRWTRKCFAADYLNELILEEIRNQPKPEPIRLKPGKRTQPYAGPFPRGKHSHRCANCDERSVACYKSHCTRPQLTETCRWCANRTR